MKKKKLKKENNKMLERILELEHQAKRVKFASDMRIEALQRLNAMTENHLQIAERELQAKERLIIDHKEWIELLIKNQELPSFS